MSHTTTETIEIDDLEVLRGSEVWACEVSADVTVETGCDHGDGGLTSYGSGPWGETEVDADTVEATCVRIGSDGEEIETRTLEGQEALDFTGAGDELIQRAEEAHN